MASDLKDIEDILDKLSLVIPRGDIDISNERHEYRSHKEVYFLDKAPITSVTNVTGTQNGTPGQTFTQGVDYQIIDDDGDGEDDSIDWSISGNTPDDNTGFFVDYRAEAVIKRYIDAHDADVDQVEDALNSIVVEGQINNATGHHLDLIGAIFGQLGKRRGRNNQQYRALLKSIVQSFQGRGTKPGMKSAIAAGIGTDPSNVTIVEDTDNTGYEVTIDPSVNTTAIGQVINDLAELADPSGVKLLSNPVFLFDGDTIPITATESSVTSTTTGLGGGTLTLDGNSNFPTGTGGTTLTWDSGENWDTSTWG